MPSVVSINMEVVHEADALEIVLGSKPRMNIRSQCIDGGSNSVVLISALEFVQGIVRTISTLRSRGGEMLGQHFLHDFQPSPSLGTHTPYLLLPIVVDLPHSTPQPLPTQHRTLPPTPRYTHAYTRLLQPVSSNIQAISAKDQRYMRTAHKRAPFSENVGVSHSCIRGMLAALSSGERVDVEG